MKMRVSVEVLLRLRARSNNEVLLVSCAIVQLIQQSLRKRVYMCFFVNPDDFEVKTYLFSL